MRKVLIFLMAAFFFLAPASVRAGWDPVKGPSGAWVFIVIAGSDILTPRLNTLSEKLGGEGGAAVKELQNEIRNGVAGELGVPPAAIDLSKPMAIAVFNPLMGEGPVASIVALSGGSTPPAGVELINGYAVSSDSETLAGQVRSAFKTVGKIEPPKGAARIYVDFGTIFQMFGPMIQMQAGMSMSKLPPANAQAATAILDFVFNIMGQVENFAVTLDVKDDAIVADADVKARAGSDIAQICGNQSPGGSSLASLVGDGTLTLNSRLKGLSGWLLRVSDRMIEKLLPDPKDQDSFRQAIKTWLGNVGDDFALAYRLTEGGIKADMAAEFSGSIDDARAYYRYFVSDKMPASLKKLMNAGGGDMQFNLQEGVRQSGGVTVDRFTTRIGDPAKLPPEVKKQIEILWGKEGMAGEYAVVNGTWVLALGGADMSARLDRLIAEAGKAHPPAPGKPPVNFTFDLIQAVNWGMKISGQAGGKTVPAGDPIVGSVTFSGRTVSKHISIPLSTVSKIQKALAEETAPPPFPPPGPGGGSPPERLQKEKL